MYPHYFLSKQVSAYVAASVYYDDEKAIRYTKVLFLIIHHSYHFQSFPSIYVQTIKKCPCLFQDKSITM